MARDKVLIKCRVPGDTHDFVKKRKAGIDINEAVVKALFKKHKKQFTVVQWHFPDKSSTKVPADTVTAEQLSSQDTEAELQPPVQLSSLQQDLDKAVKEAARASEHDMMLEQMESDMQDRIVEVAVRVAGRLVKRNTPHDDLALLTALCKDNVKRGQLQHWLKDSNSCEEPEDYAAHFDRLYHKRCGREHPNDADLSSMVQDILKKPFYRRVRDKGVCLRECTMLDNYASLTSLFK